MHKHVYQAVIWSVLSYGLPLWYCINGKGCKAQVKLLQKTQNVALCWISGAFQTTPIPWIELVTGIAPVEQRANYAIQNALQHGSKLDYSHILNHIACADHLHPTLPVDCPSQHAVSNNIGIIKCSYVEVPSLFLRDPIACIGSRVLDYSSHVRLNILAAPPRTSKVFEQWYRAWFQSCYEDAKEATCVGTDRSYKVKGQGVSAFIVMNGDNVIHSHTQLVAAHSSYDVEMHAIHNAIAHVTNSITGCIIVFIDNQAAIKSALHLKAHSLFEMS